MGTISYLLNSDDVCDEFTIGIRESNKILRDFLEEMKNENYGINSHIVCGSISDIVDLLFREDNLTDEPRVSFGSEINLANKYSFSILRPERYNYDVIAIINKSFDTDISVMHYRSLSLDFRTVKEKICSFINDYIGGVKKIYYDEALINIYIDSLKPFGYMDNRWPCDPYKRKEMLSYVSRNIDEDKIWVHPLKLTEALFEPIGLNINLPLYFNDANDNHYCLVITRPYNEMYILAIIYDCYEGDVWYLKLNDIDKTKVQINNFIYDFCRTVLKTKRVLFDFGQYIDLIKSGLNKASVIPFWSIDGGDIQDD